MTTEKCPRCNQLMVLQKAAPQFSRQTILYCLKCQTTFFLPVESIDDSPLIQPNSERKPRVLLVDDDTDLLSIMELQFNTAGFDTILANNGEQAYELLLESTPDLIITDIFLPYMDGWELTSKIRNSQELGYVPIVLITGIYTGAEFKTKALKSGVDAFITKPYNEEILLQIARKLIEQFTDITIKSVSPKNTL